MNTKIDPTLPRSERFRNEREPAWRELDRLVTLAERRGLRRLGAEGAVRLPYLYRLTLSSLSVARAISLDQNVKEYLEGLSTRAYLAVYGPHLSLPRVATHLFLHRFPQSFRQHRWPLLVSAALLLVGAVLGFGLTYGDLEWYWSLMPEAMAQGRGPDTPPEVLESQLNESQDRGLAAFASTLFAHNSQVALLCFGLGFALAIPTMLLLLMNGVYLGAFAALHHRKGLGVDVWAWLLPHGITELSAIIIAGAGGLAIGWRVMNPGVESRVAALADQGRRSAALMVGAVVMLLVAALIEGFFRQLVTDPVVRFSVAVTTGLVWVVFLGARGREAARS